MTDSNFKLLGLAIHLAASKSKSYQESTICYFQKLTEFFQEGFARVRPEWHLIGVSRYGAYV